MAQRRWPTVTCGRASVSILGWRFKIGFLSRVVSAHRTLRVRLRRSIESFFGRHGRWRAGRFTLGSRLTQAKVAGGKNNGDLRDDGIRRVFMKLHAHLLLWEARINGYQGDGTTTRHAKNSSPGRHCSRADSVPQNEGDLC